MSNSKQPLLYGVSSGLKKPKREEMDQERGIRQPTIPSYKSFQEVDLIVILEIHREEHSTIR